MSSRRRDPFSTPARRRRLIAEMAKKALRLYCITAADNVARLRIETKAITAIQCLVRCFFAKKKHYLLLFAKRTKAATKIQALVRRKQAIKLRRRLSAELRLRRMKRIAEVVTNMWENRKMRMARVAMMIAMKLAREKRERRAATNIQRVFRGDRGRTRYYQLHAAHQAHLRRFNAAAVLIQCKIRQYLATKYVRYWLGRKRSGLLIKRSVLGWWRLRKLRRCRAAKTVQRCVRGFSARLLVQQLRQERERGYDRAFAAIIADLQSEVEDELIRQVVHHTLPPEHRMEVHVDLDADVLQRWTQSSSSSSSSSTTTTAAAADSSSGPGAVVSWSLENAILHYRIGQGFSAGAIVQQVVRSVDIALSDNNTEPNNALVSSSLPSIPTSDNGSPLDDPVQQDDLPPPLLADGKRPMIQRSGSSTLSSTHTHQLSQEERLIALHGWDEGDPSDKPLLELLPTAWGQQVHDSMNEVDLLHQTFAKTNKLSTADVVVPIGAGVKVEQSENVFDVTAAENSLAMADSARSSMAHHTKYARVELHITTNIPHIPHIPVDTAVTANGSAKSAPLSHPPAEQPFTIELGPSYEYIRNVIVLVFNPLHDSNDSGATAVDSSRDAKQSQPFDSATSSKKDLKFRFKNALVFVNPPTEPSQNPNSKPVEDPEPADPKMEKEEEDQEEEEEEEEELVVIAESQPEVIERPLTAPTTAVVRIVLRDPTPSPPPIDYNVHARLLQRAIRRRHHRKLRLIERVQRLIRRRNTLFLWHELVYTVLELAHDAATLIQSLMRRWLAVCRVHNLRLEREEADFKARFGHDFMLNEALNWHSFGLPVPTCDPHSELLYSNPVLSIPFETVVSATTTREEDDDDDDDNSDSSTMAKSTKLLLRHLQPPPVTEVLDLMDYPSAPPNCFAPTAGASEAADVLMMMTLPRFCNVFQPPLLPTPPLRPRAQVAATAVTATAAAAVAAAGDQQNDSSTGTGAGTGSGPVENGNNTREVRHTDNNKQGEEMHGKEDVMQQDAATTASTAATAALGTVGTVGTDRLLEEEQHRSSKKDAVIGDTKNDEDADGENAGCDVGYFSLTGTIRQRVIRSFLTFSRSRNTATTATTVNNTMAHSRIVKSQPEIKESAGAATSPAAKKDPSVLDPMSGSEVESDAAEEAGLTAQLGQSEVLPVVSELEHLQYRENNLGDIVWSKSHTRVGTLDYALQYTIAHSGQTFDAARNYRTNEIENSSYEANESQESTNIDSDQIRNASNDASMRTGNAINLILRQWQHRKRLHKSPNTCDKSTATQYEKKQQRQENLKRDTALVKDRLEAEAPIYKLLSKVLI